MYATATPLSARRRAPMAGRTILVTCATCGAEFTRARSKADRGPYCSRACRRAAHASACPGCAECRDWQPPASRAGELPVPPLAWCRVCGVRPVAARGPYSRDCARCRAVAAAPVLPDPPRCSLAVYRRRTRRQIQLEYEATHY